MVNVQVAMARLFIRGKDYGPHSFVVPIRDMATHLPLPGIRVGDIGPKFGYNGVDNGFLSFNHVAVPRENMLMRFAKVKTHCIAAVSKHAPLRVVFSTPSLFCADSLNSLPLPVYFARSFASCSAFHKGHLKAAWRRANAEMRYCLSYKEVSP